MTKNQLLERITHLEKTVLDSRNESQDFVNELRAVLGKNFTNKKEILAEVIRLVGYVSLTEARKYQTAEENDRLMYLIKVLIKDPIITAKAKLVEKRDPDYTGPNMYP